MESQSAFTCVHVFKCIHLLKYLCICINACNYACIFSYFYVGELAGSVDPAAACFDPRTPPKTDSRSDAPTPAPQLQVSSCLFSQN